jgi:hypothetical protein
VRFRLLAAILALALTGCASQLKQQYVRTDGTSFDNADMQGALGQCKGEVANSNLKPNRIVGSEAAIIDACMARNGYIRPR